MKNIQRALIPVFLLLSFQSFASDWKVEIVDLEEQHTASITETVKMKDIAEFYGRVFPRIAQFIGHFQLESGRPYGRYLEVGEESLKIEAGFFVTTAAPCCQDIVGGKIPATKAAKLIHLGAYENLPRAGKYLEQWLGEQGYESAGPMWEVYANDPTTVTEDQIKTIMYWPIK